MDSIDRLNPHPLRANIWGSGELTGIMPVDLAHNRYHDYLELLKKRKLKLIHIACLKSEEKRGDFVGKRTEEN
jgi:hypothetical protein